jgi:glucose/mannose transport system permease protein
MALARSSALAVGAAAPARRAVRPGWRDPLLAVLRWLVIWVPLLLNAGHVVVFTLWTGWVSFTPSTLLPASGFVGWRNYQAILATRNWKIAYDNLLLFGIGFVLLAMALGLLLAVLLDQRVRGEAVLRTIFLYPMAVSFVVTGTVWGWLLNPSLGIQHLVQGWGFAGFRFDWLVDRDRAIYTVVIAGAWQASGFAMALFLAGLRSVDSEIVRAAQIDGAGPWRIYGWVVLPTLGPIFAAVLVILLQFAIKTFDLVRALTGGGPGLATTLPALVVYDFMFQRGLLGRGSAAAVMMLGTLLVVLLPYAGYRAHIGRRAARRG